MPDIREVLVEIAARLGGAPDRAAELIRERAEASDRLHKALGALEEFEAKVAGEVAAARDQDGRPLYPNEAARKAEVLRRLAADRDYQALEAEADAARARLHGLDAEIERASLRHRSDYAVVRLAAALLGAGKADIAEAVLGAYHRAGADTDGSANANGTGADGTNARSATSQDQAPQGQVFFQGQGHTQAQGQGQAQPQTQGQGGQGHAQPRGQDNGLEASVFTVLEARPGSSPGTVRAWCEGADGRKVAVYGKNGAGEALAGAVGRRVEVRYRRGDKGLIAVEARPVA